MIPARPRMSTPALLLVLVMGGLAWCGADPEVPAAAVTEQEARDAVAGVVALAARQTPEAMDRLCVENDGCPGMSSGARYAPQDAPGPGDPPRELCVLGLPATPTQAGSRLVVLEGVDGRGRPYTTQVLVDRDGDGTPVVQEPAFWLGIRYTAAQGGRAWDSLLDDPAQRQQHDVQTRRACTESDSWLAEVASPPGGASDG